MKGGLTSEHSDVDLVAAVRAGGITADRAFADLLARHRGAVWSASKGWFAPGNGHADVFQAAMVGLWEATMSWDGRQPFHVWVGFVARRKVITLVKEATRGKQSPLRGFGELSQAAEPIWEGGLCEIETAQALKELFTQAQLTNLEVAVLAMWLDGYGYDEIAGQVGGDRRRVDNALQRAKRKTKAWVEQQWVTDSAVAG